VDVVHVILVTNLGMSASIAVLMAMIGVRFVAHATSLQELGERSNNCKGFANRPRQGLVSRHLFSLACAAARSSDRGSVHASTNDFRILAVKPQMCHSR
jgi:hypothetical protein